MLSLCLALLAQGYAESPYIFGLHDPGGERHMAEKGRKGWILFTESVGRNPAETHGRDYRPWADQGYGIIVRLNHGYGPHEGTLPYQKHYDNFAQRCANWVAASRGCRIWLIGNETNLSIEWPRYEGVTEVISPALYASCYLKCRARVKALAGHESDQVLTQATGPWNIQSGMGWIEYHVAMIDAIGQGNLDGLALHTYTHGTDPALIWSDTKMAPPYQNRHYHFRTYRDFLDSHPSWARSLPCYITEANENVPWLDANNGWIRAAYAEIHAWNQTPGTQKIRALIPYRWRAYDDKGMEFKNGVIEDFRAACGNDYRWSTSSAPPPPPPPPAGAADVVVDSIGVSTAVSGQAVTFSCVVRNQGGSATPSGVVIGVGYKVNGVQVTWGSVMGPLGPGASITIGTQGGAWTAGAAGTYSLTAHADDVNRFAEANEGNNQRTTSFAVSGSAPPPATSVTQGFEAMPVWHDTAEASWGSAGAWTVLAGGQAGNFLRASRTSAGSSARALVFVVPSNRTIDLSAYLRCSSSGTPYWAEFAYRLGSWSADDFDANAGSWTLVKKFAPSGQNGNGGAWTRYAAPVPTGAFTVLTVAFKLGGSGPGVPSLDIDTLRLSW